MTLDGILFMILVLGLIWGGFIYTLSLAIKREAEKTGAHEH